MVRFGFALRSAGCAMALMVLASCGGDDAPTPEPTPTSTPTPTPTPSAPTYKKLSELRGDQLFDSAGITYTIDTSTNPPGPVANLTAQAFGGGTRIEFFDTTDKFKLTAPGGSPTVEFDESAGTVVSPNVRRWTVPVGSSSPTSVITLFQGAGEYVFLSSWQNIAGNTSTFRLGTAGVLTFVSDLPTTSVTYNIALGGSVRNGSANPITVDSTRSTGTMVINFANRTGTLTVPLVASDGTALGTVTGTVTLPTNVASFSGTITFGGNNGVISGAFFGPNAIEVGYAAGMTSSSQTYVGLGAGKKQ